MSVRLKYLLVESLRRSQAAALLVASLGASGAMAEIGEQVCQCRSPGGERRDLGTVECLRISGRAWLMRCEMSQNTPYWNRLNQQQGCADA